MNMQTEERIPLALLAVELDYVAQVLRKRPFEEVSGLLANLQAQVDQYNRQKEEAREGASKLVGVAGGEPNG